MVSADFSILPSKKRRIISSIDLEFLGGWITSKPLFWDHSTLGSFDCSHFFSWWSNCQTEVSLSFSFLVVRCMGIAPRKNPRFDCVPSTSMVLAAAAQQHRPGCARYGGSATRTLRFWKFVSFVQLLLAGKAALNTVLEALAWGWLGLNMVELFMRVTMASEGFWKGNSEIPSGNLT